MEVFLIDFWDLINQDKQNKLLGEAVSITGEIVPFEYFYQTSWLGRFFLINFFRQPVTKLGEVFPHERVLQTLQFKLLSFIVSFQDEREWSTALVVFSFMISLVFYGCLSFQAVFRKWENSFANTFNKFFANISFASLESSCFNFFSFQIIRLNTFFFKRLA